MPTPTTAQLRPVGDPLLSNLLVAYMNEDADFIARRAAPVMPVEEESGTYVTVDKSRWFSDSLERRAPGTAYAKGGFEFGSDTYVTLQWAEEVPLADEHQATSQVPMELQEVALRYLAHKSNLRKEIAFAADFMAASVWTNTDNNSATDWDDASGVPVTNIRTAKRTIKQLGVGTANALFMGEIVYDGLITNAQVVDYLKHTRSLTVAEVEGVLAAVLGVEILGVSRAIYNTANVGQSDSLSPIIDDDALLCVVDPAPTRFSVQALKTFAWNGGGGEGSARTYRSESHDADMVKHKEQWDQKLISADAGYLWLDIV